MVVKYQDEITESLESLTQLQLEKQLRTSPLIHRVTMLRLLKSGQVKTQTDCAKLIGYTDRQLRNWWREYKSSGLDGLIRPKSKGHRQSQLSDEAYQALCKQMKKGLIATVNQAVDYLDGHFSIHYTIPGLWYQLKAREVKKKTGRRRHRKADAAQQESFKKTSLNG